MAASPKINAWLTGEQIPSSYQYWCSDELRTYEPWHCLATINYPKEFTQKNGDLKPCLGTGVCTDSKEFVCKIF